MPHTPAYEEIVRVTKYIYAGDGAPVSLNATVRHFAPSGPFALLIPFDSLPDGNVINITGLPVPPPSPPPPTAPPPPRHPTCADYYSAGFTTSGVYAVTLVDDSVLRRCLASEILMI